MDKHTCRACYGSAGDLVLDLGEQPACDYFPQCRRPGPGPGVPAADVAVFIVRPGPVAGRSHRARGAEGHRACRARRSGRRRRGTGRRGGIPAGPGRGRRVRQSRTAGPGWSLLAARGLVPSGPGGQADVILDCFGLMHAADQHRALAERAARVAPGGVLLLQYHALSTIIGHRQWNALRHGHFAYYSTTALTAMLAAVGFSSPHRLAFRPLRRHRLAGRVQGRRSGQRTRRCRRGRCSRTTLASVSATLAPSLAFSAMCVATLRPCMTGWWPSDPPEARFSATAPRRGRSRCCAMRMWIARCCLRWLTPRRPSRDGGCRELTFRWPIPPSSPRAGQTRYCSSSRTCWPKSGTPTRRSRPQAAGGSTLRHLAHEACSRTRSRARHRPRVGPMLPTGSPSSSDMSA